ncbi:hypothetical protein CK203_056642 [Vitis vinifera]|uniref:Uncharacterized protein n=1 Tax=Vitis vinifera TaxID=29760 RepID=A0A438GNQ3_VITVI|nr:hypothetical protein CK203_056642 [Vitis vinifera]
MSDFFPLTKRVSINMGGNLPAFVSARLPLAPSSPPCLVSSICRNGRCQRLQKCCSWHPLHDAYSCAAFKQLEVVEAMRAFISHHSGGIKEMRSKLEMVEVDLAEEEKGAIWAEADQLKEEREALEAKYKRAEQ